MNSSDLGQEYKTMSLSLDRIKRFLSCNNIEYKRLKYIHIAGTNGKGSTAKMLATIFKDCGYKTGLYTSPHLIKINERIQINSECISDRDFNAIEKKYDKSFRKYKLTYFEKVTAIAFIYFVKKKADIVVLETGLGGRYDATNIITPLVSVITSVGLDHTEVLGKTLSKIAFEKAGIIKKQVHVVCGNIPRAALIQITEVAKDKKAQVFVFGKDFNSELIKYDWKTNSQRIVYSGQCVKREFFKVGLLGESQIYNTAVVIKVCELLKGFLNKIRFSVVKKSLRNIKFPARFDIRKIKIKNKKGSLIIDGGHNVQAVENFLRLYKQSPFYKKSNKLCFAIMQEKDYKKVVKILSGEFTNISLIKLDNSRAVDVSILKKEFLKHSFKKIDVLNDVSEIFENIKNNKTIIVLGSFFLAGRILQFIKGIKNE
ncbi:MAG: bifunctional folylpolyglutamate synthase/dihydrofolate synthase [Elusimicrobia bacterium]|nr:bifunctional folylpolyglutamate synthase/dihydrofolate synthase [Elusimicrobiota bacterium]